ncbi:MAG: hypothetical protein Q4Q04_01100 [Methanocorpusculum sp.]|nr:hypothetical protein [Methanocorpusculum sp.]
MLEYPEVTARTHQLNEFIRGKEVASVLPPTKPHKFCWFSGEPDTYAPAVKGSKIAYAEGFGIFVELSFDNGYRLCYNDGVHTRLLSPDETRPKDYQLLIQFADGYGLAFIVAMYGGIILHAGEYDNPYYQTSREALPLASPAFKEHYLSFFTPENRNLSLKALLATGQHFPGIGNGVLQDILFTAGFQPKKKISSLSASEQETLYASMISVLQKMTAEGGRDTEKDIFGKPGGYTTLMSKHALKTGCPVCGGEVVKETYLGGSVYYCPHCQNI